MFKLIQKNRTLYQFRLTVVMVLLAFLLSLPGYSYAQIFAVLPSPGASPGAMVTLTPPFSPSLIKGIMIHPENPLQLDFLIDPGQADFRDKTKQNKTKRKNTVNSSNIFSPL